MFAHSRIKCLNKFSWNCIINLALEKILSLSLCIHCISSLMSGVMGGELLYTYILLLAKKAAPVASYNIQVFTGPTEGEILQLTSFLVIFLVSSYLYVYKRLCLQKIM